MRNLKLKDIDFFEKKARQVRHQIFEKLVALDQGHPGSTMSVVDLVVALYYGGYLRIPSREDMSTSDKLIISKGHASMVHYPVLADLGCLDRAEWERWGAGSSLLRVFANISMPGIAASMGSLGHGVGVGAGYALSYRKRGIDRRVFVVLSEGELYEGSTWEGLLFAAHHKLENLHFILDRNQLIILGKSEECVALEPVVAKLESFGLRTLTCDGHDFKDIFRALDDMLAGGGPTCLVANTVKGKGFSVMENDPSWHYWQKLSPAQIETCIREIA